MKAEIKTKEFLGKHSLVENPELVKVLTIKKKYIEQMPSMELKYNPPYLPEVLEVFGRVLGLIIVRDTAGRFMKISKIDYWRYLKMAEREWG